MKNETVIFPNPNQLILLRKLQKESGAIPVLPLCVRSEAIQSIGDRISTAELLSIGANENMIFITVRLVINGTEAAGRIELAEFSKGNDSISEEKLKLLEETMRSTVKKLSPFRIVDMTIEKMENGHIWRVTKEKWQK